MASWVTKRRLCIAAVVAALVVLTVWCCTWYFSFDQRFARSKVALDAYAQQSMIGSPIATQVGAFNVSDPVALPSGFIVRCDYGHPFDWNGLAFSTAPLPGKLVDPQSPKGTILCHPIGGNWYRVSRY
jgi:hypothetical protein